MPQRKTSNKGASQTNYRFSALIQRTEELVKKFYKINQDLSAQAFLVSTPLKDLVSANPLIDLSRRANLILKTSSNETLEIALYFSQDIKKNLYHNDPFAELNHHNIDSFLTLIEELSHFHLLIDRATKNRTTSQLELEWQGEVDKVLIANMILEKQTKKNHISQLYELVFKNSLIYRNESLYLEADLYAAKFWKYFIERHPSRRLTITDRFRSFMQRNYRAPLWDKFPFVETSLTHF